MALTETRRQSQDLILTCAEPQQRASQEFSVARAYTPSAITTTTFTDANVAATSVGNYVVPQDGDAFGQIRQIKSVSSTTATLDAPWISVTGTTRLQAWSPPDIPVRVTTADAASLYDVITTLHAGVANEPNGYWDNKGYQLLGRSGANAGRARAFSSFTSTAGTFVDGASTTTAVGDLFDLRKMIRPFKEVDAKVTHRALERPIIGTGELDADVPVPITTEGTLGIELVLRPLPAGAGSGVQASIPTEMGDIFQDMFTETRDTGGTVADVSTPGQILCNTSVFSKGGFALLTTGEAVHIYAVSTDFTDITAYGTGQATQAAVAASSVANASVWYQRKAVDYRTRTWDLYRGGKVRQLFHGSMGNMKTTIARDQLITFAMEYMSPEALEYNVDRPVAAQTLYPIAVGDYGTPSDGKGARTLLDGYKVVIEQMTIDWGFTPKLRKSVSGINQGDGCMMDTGPIKGTIAFYADNDDITGFRALVDRFAARKYQQFLYQKGTAVKDTFCIGIPAMHFISSTFEYNDRQGMVTTEFTCVKPEAAGYAAATYAGLPACSMGLL